MTPETLTITLTKKDTHFLIEALQQLEKKWIEINHTSDDEDEQAEYGMDALELHGIREAIEDEAVKVFGESIKKFSRKPL